jgi:hypothetical protein
MSKLQSFVRLDFVTVKPYFTVKTLLIYMAMTIYMAIITKNVASAIGVGMLFATMNIGYPCALGEKCNMDALYVTLGADKKTVVKGRYIFALLFNICAIAAVTAISLAALAVTGTLGSAGETFGVLGAALAISVIFLLVQSAQIPLYFKFGYSKAKLFSVLPFFLIAAFVAYFTISVQGGMSDAMIAFAEFIADNARAIAAATVVFLMIVVFVSYKLSLTFYKKREF